MARILVIEDNPTNLDLMLYLLNAFGHTPLAATDGEEGLALIKRETPHLVVCDVQLPKLSGYEVVQQLKADPLLRTIPVLAVTAYAMVGDRDKVLAAGFDGYLTKPIQPERFISQVESFLGLEQRSTPPQPHSQAVDIMPIPASRATILVVDSSAVNCDLLCSILKPSGYTVLVAKQVKEALVLCHQTRPDLILSDLHLPDNDGFYLVRTIRADPSLHKTAVIFLSSRTKSAREHQEALALAARVLSRPVEPAVLLKEIETCLKQVTGLPQSSRSFL